MPKFAVATSDFNNNLEIHFFDCVDTEAALRLGIMELSDGNFDESELPEGEDALIEFANDMDCNVTVARVP